MHNNADPVRIIFATHATSVDNEAGIASGHDDCDLSAQGRREARDLSTLVSSDLLAAIYCSDLRRSYLTAEIAFAESPIPIVRDQRLRECDYGDLTSASAQVIERERLARIERSFPNGESYMQVAKRMQSLLRELLTDHVGQQVLIVGHRATYYSLEHWVNGVPLADVIAARWEWQPTWSYELPRSRVAAWTSAAEA